VRILFATDHIHIPQGAGGGERNTHDLCLALQQLGDDVAVLCSLRSDGSLFSLTSRVRRKVPRSREFSRDQICGYRVYRGWNTTAMHEVLGEFRPDIVVVQSTHPDPLVDEVRRFNLPQVIYLHEVEEVIHLRRLKALGIQVIGNSKFVADRLSTACGLDCDVVYPIVDPAHYRAHKHSKSVLFVNTVPRKGLDIALAIAAKRPDVPFNFMLSSTMKADALSELRQQTRTLVNVRLRRPTQDMRFFYSRTGLLLAPSKWEEAWGRVVTEAHLNGIPVLASDRGGLPESVGPGGITISPDAPLDKWLGGMQLLWDNPVARSAYASAAELYSNRSEIQPSSIVSHFKSILASVLRCY